MCAIYRRVWQRSVWQIGNESEPLKQSVEVSPVLIKLRGIRRVSRRAEWENNAAEDADLMCEIGTSYAHLHWRIRIRVHILEGSPPPPMFLSLIVIVCGETYTRRPHIKNFPKLQVASCTLKQEGGGVARLC